MKPISFPIRDTKDLMSGKKTVTIRIGREVGKYKQGSSYRAITKETKKEIGVVVRVVAVARTEIENLERIGFPKSVAKRVREEGGKGLAEIIYFLSYGKDGKPLQK